MEWEDFKALYGRDYGAEEEDRRREVYAQTVEIIRRNNAEADASPDPNHVRLGVNDFSDMTKAEFSMLNTYLMPNVSTSDVTILSPVDGNATIDWRTKGAVTPVKNQYRCGGCWSFASIAVTEAAYKIATGTLRSLSEQQLLDCSNQGGCLGGTTPGGLGYVISNHGVDQESEYTWAEGTAPNPFVQPSFPITASLITPTGTESSVCVDVCAYWSGHRSFSAGRAQRPTTPRPSVRRRKSRSGTSPVSQPASVRASVHLRRRR
jgi:hypothetical protein